MATVRKSNFDWNGQPYWGLVQQNGPWSSTPGDIRRANMKDVGTYGGGIGVGGRGHAGNSIFESFMTPYQINATGAPPPPSNYAKPTVMMGPVDMKRATKMGKAKQGLTLAARTPLQTGYKMGGAKEDIIQTEAGDIMPPIVVEGTNQFGSTHHIMEMPPLLSPSDVSFDGSSTPAYINQLDTNLRSVVNNAGYGDTDSRVTGYTKMFRKPESVYKFRDDSTTSSKTSKTASTSLGSMASMTNPVPDPILTYYPIEIPDVPIEIEEPETADYPIEYQSPDIVDTTMTQNLNMSEAFLKSIADYDKAQSTRMQKKRDSFKEPTERPIGAPTGAGKKTALDGTFLAEEANRGLTDNSSKPMSDKARGKRPAPIVTSPTESKPSKPASSKTPSPVRKTAGPSKPTASSAKPKPGPSKPAAKTEPSRGRPATRGETVSRNRTKSPGGPVKVRYQRVTNKGAAALYKKFGYKIKDRFESMKEDDVQYKITKAAYELYKNDK